MGEDDIICILPGLVSLCMELVQCYLMILVHLTGCVCAEGSIAGHAPHIDCFMGHGAVHGFKPREVLKLLSKFCIQSLALWLAGRSLPSALKVSMDGSRMGENGLCSCHILLVTCCNLATLAMGVMLLQPTPAAPW